MKLTESEYENARRIAKSLIKACAETSSLEMKLDSTPAPAGNRPDAVDSEAIKLAKRALKAAARAV